MPIRAPRWSFFASLRQFLRSEPGSRRRKTARRTDSAEQAERHAETGSEIAERICRRLRMSNEEIERVVSLVKTHVESFPKAKRMEGKRAGNGFCAGRISTNTWNYTGRTA